MNIVAFSGRAQSGKNTCCNFLTGNELQSLGLIESFKIGDDGNLYCRVNDLKENEYVRFDPLSVDPYAAEWRSVNLDQYVKVHSFASWLKMICVEVLQLNPEHVYGGQQEKNQLTHLLWENMPLPPALLNSASLRKEHQKKTGQMTVREVLQYFGSDLMRSMLSNVWVDRLIKDLKRFNSELSLVSDLRFRDEADALKAEGAKLIRLTRTVTSYDHKSENDLDDYDGFDYILDNQNLTIAEQNQKVYETLKEWGYLQYEIVAV